MYKAILNSIAGIEVYPVIGFMLFFTLFIGIVFWTFRQDKALMERMANLPNETDQEDK